MTFLLQTTSPPSSVLFSLLLSPSSCVADRDRSSHKGKAKQKSFRLNTTISRQCEVCVEPSPMVAAKKKGASNHHTNHHTWVHSHVASMHDMLRLHIAAAAQCSRGGPRLLSASIPNPKFSSARIHGFLLVFSFKNSGSSCLNWSCLKHFFVCWWW